MTFLCYLWLLNYNKGNVNLGSLFLSLFYVYFCILLDYIRLICFGFLSSHFSSSSLVTRLRFVSEKQSPNIFQKCPIYATVSSKIIANNDSIWTQTSWQSNVLTK